MDKMKDGVVSSFWDNEQEDYEISDYSDINEYYAHLKGE